MIKSEVKYKCNNYGWEYLPVFERCPICGLKMYDYPPTKRGERN